MKSLLLTFLVASLLCLLASANTCEEQNINTFMNHLNSTVAQVIFTSTNADKLYVRTSSNDVYYSEDHGRTFTPIMNLLVNFYETYGSPFHGVHSMHKGATDGLVYFSGASGKVYWITRSHPYYKEYETGDSYLFRIDPHPQDSNIVLRALESCPSDANCTVTLEVSEQQGTVGTWNPIRRNVYDFVWGEANQIIYISVEDSMLNNDFRFISTADRRLFVTYSLNEHYEFESDPGFYDFVLIDDVLYVAHYDGGATNVYLTTDFGDSYTMAEFREGTSVPHINSSHFVITDSSEGVTFITVCNDDSPGSTLYQADSGNGEFWYTLGNHRTTCDSYFVSSDFQKILSMDGAYFANVYDVDAAGDENVENYIQSRITYNKGASWRSIPAPAGSDCEGEDCFLNLFSVADRETASLYSTSKASGLITAVGNVGKYRQPVNTAASTYFSRNGGWEWEKILDGAYTTEISRHASLLFAASEDPSTDILYSWKQGSDFNTCQLYDTPIRVLNILDVSSASDVVELIIIGSYQNQGYIGLMNFTNNVPRVCTGYDDPGSSDSDYELVSAQVDGTCLLGQKTFVIRRKRDADCLSLHGESSPTSEACECTRADYTCAGDCWREVQTDEGTFECVNDCVGLPNDPEAPPADCQTTYLKPSGYRQVDDDQCQGGLLLELPIETDCPGYNSPTSSSPSMAPSPSSPPPPGVSASPSPSVAPGSSESSEAPTPDDTSIVAIFAAVIGVFVTIAILAVILIAILYKTNPRVRGLLNRHLPVSMGGGSGETKMYSVLGGGDDGSALFGDDDMFLDDNESGPVSSDKTPLGSLLDFDDDDDAEGAIDIQL